MRRAYTPRDIQNASPAKVERIAREILQKEAELIGVRYLTKEDVESWCKREVQRRGE